MRRRRHEGRDTGLEGRRLGEARAIPRRDLCRERWWEPDPCWRAHSCCRPPMPKPAQASCPQRPKISRVITRRRSPACAVAIPALSRPPMRCAMAR